MTTRTARAQGSSRKTANRPGVASAEEERVQGYAAGRERDEAWFRSLAEQDPPTTRRGGGAGSEAAGRVSGKARSEFVREAHDLLAAALDRASSRDDALRSDLSEGLAGCMTTDPAARWFVARVPTSHRNGWSCGPWSPLVHVAQAAWTTVGGLLGLTWSLEAVWVRCSQEAVLQSAHVFRSAQEALGHLLSSPRCPRPDGPGGAIREATPAL